MKNIIIIISSFILIYSCKKNTEKKYFEDGSVKETTYINKDSVVSFEASGNIKMIEKFYNQDSVYLWNYKDNKVISKGVMFKKEAFGIWNFFKNDKLDVVREFIRIDNHHYMNQVWYFDKNKDTVKSKGNYYKITFNDTIKVNSTEIIRLYLEQPLDNKVDEMHVNFKDFFYNERTNKVEKDSGQILGLKNEVLLEFTFKDVGKYNFKGHFEQNYYIKNSKDKVVRKLYFDKELVIVDTDTNNNED